MKSAIVVVAFLANAATAADPAPAPPAAESAADSGYVEEKAAPKKKPAPFAAIVMPGGGEQNKATLRVAQAPALALPAGLPERLAIYQGAVDALRKPGVDEPFCAVVDEANALVQALQEPLAKQRDAVSKEPAKQQAFTEALEALNRDLTGITASNGVEALAVTRDDGELAPRAPTLAAEEIHAAAAPLVRPWPIWITQMTDVQGCVQPDAATSGLVALRRAWETGPKCVKQRMKADLKKAVARIGESDWFCDDAAVTTRAVRKTEESLVALPAELGGEGVAKKLDARLKDKATRFGKSVPPAVPMPIPAPPAKK